MITIALLFATGTALGVFCFLRAVLRANTAQAGFVLALAVLNWLGLTACIVWGQP